MANTTSQGNTGYDNTAVGYSALYSNTGGRYNTAIGNHALNNNLTGNNNVALGDTCRLQSDTGSNNIYIGAGMAGLAGESNSCYIGEHLGPDLFRRSRRLH